MVSLDYAIAESSQYWHNNEFETVLIPADTS